MAANENAPAVAIAEQGEPAMLVYARPRVTGAARSAGRASASEDSQAWLAALRGSMGARDEAVAELHALLLRGARYELQRRRGSLSHVSSGEIDDLAHPGR